MRNLPQRVGKSASAILRTSELTTPLYVQVVAARSLAFPSRLVRIEILACAAGLLRCGAIAQLGERIVRNDEVVGSIPTSSTMFSVISERLPGAGTAFVT